MRNGLKSLSLIAALATLGWSSDAQASADGGCTTDWIVTSTGFDGCNNSPALQPGNDTRANILLMLLDTRKIAPSTGKLVISKDDYDAAPFSPFQPWFETVRYYLPQTPPRDYDRGTRCQTDESGRAAFVGAVNAARGLSAGERSALVSARTAMKADCNGDNNSGMAVEQLTSALASAEGKAFGAYLQGALAFYDGRQGEAQSLFAAAAKGRDAWLKDASHYMIARAALNEAQEGLYDKYGYRDRDVALDNAKLKTAENAFNAYIKNNPRGAYAASARGLLRRVYWLGGDFPKLENEYARLIADPNQDIASLAEEIDLKYLSGAKSSKNPLLVATMDLARMRGGGEYYGPDGCCSKPLGAEELAGQADIFRNHTALFDYLKAAHAYYVGNNPRAVVQMIPDAARQKEFSHVQFARQMLRGEALEALKDRNARGFWLEMLSGAKSENQRWLLELAIANHDEKQGQLARVFAKDSPVKNKMIRRILLVNSADAPLLRQQARNSNAPKEERDVALYTLLQKELRSGAYKNFLTDVEMVPANAVKPGSDSGYLYVYSDEPTVPLGLFRATVSEAIYPCPDIKGVAGLLAANPDHPKGQLCLAEFSRTYLEAGWDKERAKDELGSTPSPLDARPYSRLAVYQRLIGNRSVRGNDRAMALNRAVRCFERSGYNHCGDQEIPQAQRKNWFQQLKREFPNSPIAKSLQYYW